MTARLSIPAAGFAEAFTTASGYDSGALANSAGFAGSQFRIEEDIKEYASSVEQSALLIGLDVQRLIAVDVAGIQIEVAKDKALYKAALADSVKSVKIQEARLEGSFGVDVALVKSAADFGALNAISGLQEESGTTLSQREAESVVTLSLEEETSAAYVLGRERDFRISMSDTDYASSVSIADTRRGSILAKGLLDTQAVAKESDINDVGLSTAYTLEADGYRATAEVETTYIRASGGAEVNHMTVLSGEKVANIVALSGLEVTHIAGDAALRAGQLVAETNAQVAASSALSLLEVAHTRDSASREATLIRASAAAEDTTYLAGARADIAMDYARHKVEAEGIVKIAGASLNLIKIKAQADADTKIAVAKVQGQADLDKAIASNISEHNISVERANHSKDISALRVESIRALADARASQTSDLSTIVVGQIEADSTEAVSFIRAMASADTTKLVDMMTAETEATIAKTEEQSRHTGAMGALSGKVLLDQSAAHVKNLAALTSQATTQMGSRLVEEQRYITESATADSADIGEIGSRTLDYIGSETEIIVSRIDAEAGIKYSESINKADLDYEHTTGVSEALVGITETMAAWTETAHAGDDQWSSLWQQEIGVLASYSVGNTNYFKKSESPVGAALVASITRIDYDLPTEPALPPSA